MAYRALLKPTADATQWLSSTTVHPVYFPYPLTLVLHAVRISHAYSTKVKASGHKLPPMQHLAGFLTMAWGGALWVNALLCQPPPQLYSTTPWVIYCTTHIALNTVFSFASWPAGKLVDSAFPAIDAICRSAAIIGAMGAVKAHSNPNLANSLLAQIIIGAVSSVGGGAAAGFFGVWDNEWSLKTPGFLKGGVIATMDVWAGAVAAFIYGVATQSHPAYEPVNEFLVGKPKAWMTPLGARSIVVVFLTVMYVIRVASMHYLPKKTIRAAPIRNAVKPVGKEKKVQ